MHSDIGRPCAGAAGFERVTGRVRYLSLRRQKPPRQSGTHPEGDSAVQREASGNYLQTSAISCLYSNHIGVPEESAVSNSGAGLTEDPGPGFLNRS